MSIIITTTAPAKPTANQSTVERENVTAFLAVAAPAARVFAALADPTTHAAIDGTGWVQEAVDRAPLTEVGQIFRMDMHHPIGVPRSASPAVSLTTLTFATVLAVVRPWGRIRGAGLQESSGDEFRRGCRLYPRTRSTALEECIMTATYTFDVFSSLDGFGAAGGNWTGYWGKQGPELLARRLALYDQEQRMVFGANTYRAFARMLASSTEESEVRDPWVTRMRSLPATVVSTTLEGSLDWPDATVVSGDAVDVVARLKQESEVPLRSHGSLSLNRALMAAGLLDRVQVTLFPVITGQTGRDPIFQGAADFDLELVGSRTLDGRTQELIYRPTLHV
jgi:dihydrofolate reductase